MLTQEQKQALIAAAANARKNAYVPYSHYPVGAALLASDGTTITGTNVENAVYPTGMCAERTAVFKAVSEGYRDFVAIAVVTRNGGTPCGSCRQALREFAPDLPVIIADETGNIVHELPLTELLPFSFGPQDLDAPAP